MKYLYPFLSLVLFSSYNYKPQGSTPVQNATDTLSKPVSNPYKPGMGDFMLNIQIHHAKLWFAGQAGNWRLANFETGEIQEGLEDVQHYCADRHDVKQISKIIPALEAVNKSIEQKDKALFKIRFNLLTNSCNSCHKAANHDFIVIKVPDVPPFSNEEF
jgi:hypothetical protein